MSDRTTKTPGVAEYEPFTDSIRADIAALPADVRGVLVDDLFGEHGTPEPVNWPVVATAVFMPAAVLLAYVVFRSRLSDFHSGLMLGVTGLFALDAVAAVVGAVQRQVFIWRRRHSDTGRGQS
jgi:hypothetical protein